MFLKDQGLTDVHVTEHVGRLLSCNAFKISELAGINSMDLTRNVRLLREETKGWSGSAMLLGSNIGSRVQCAKSSTVTKRKNTVY